MGPLIWRKPHFGRPRLKASIVRNGRHCATAVANVLNKVEDEDTGAFTRPTSRANCLTCKPASAPIIADAGPLSRLPALTPDKIDDYVWLPSTCAYVLRAAGKPLPEWHYLVSGSRQTIHDAGMSVKGRAISEIHAGPLENHIVEQPL